MRGGHERVDTLRARMEPVNEHWGRAVLNPLALLCPTKGPGCSEPGLPGGDRSKRMCPSKCMVSCRCPSQASHRLSGLLRFSCWHSAWWHTCGVQLWAGTEQQRDPLTPVGCAEPPPHHHCTAQRPSEPWDCSRRAAHGWAWRERGHWRHWGHLAPTRPFMMSHAGLRVHQDLLCSQGSAGPLQSPFVFARSVSPRQDGGSKCLQQNNARKPMHFLRLCAQPQPRPGIHRHLFLNPWPAPARCTARDPLLGAAPGVGVLPGAVSPHPRYVHIWQCPTATPRAERLRCGIPGARPHCAAEEAPVHPEPPPLPALLPPGAAEVNADAARRPRSPMGPLAPSTTLLSPRLGCPHRRDAKGNPNP